MEGKATITQIKEDFRGDIKNLMLAKTMQGKITGDIKVTPADVRAYFNSIPADSLPLLNSEVEVGQITKKPPIDEKEKVRIKEKLNDLRERIVKGEDFATLAILYSEDTEERAAPSGIVVSRARIMTGSPSGSKTELALI